MIKVIVGPAVVVICPMPVFTAVKAIRPLNVASATTLGDDMAVPANHLYSAIAAEPMVNLHSAISDVHVRRPSIGTPGDRIAPRRVSHRGTLRRRPLSCRT